MCINTLQEVFDANAKSSQLLQNWQAINGNIIFSHVSFDHTIEANSDYHMGSKHMQAGQSTSPLHVRSGVKNR